MEEQKSSPLKKRTPEEADEKPKRTKTDLQFIEEQHFYSLCTQVLESIRGTERVSEEDVSSSLDKIIESFHMKDGNRFSDVDYSQFANICGYLFRYGAHGAGLVRCRVLEAARNCEALTREVLRGRSDRDLTVVSLGGGPGNDALGFCSALVELGFPESRALRVTVVDAVRQWQECVHRAVDLAKSGDFGDASRLLRRDRTTVNFQPANLPGDLVRDPACRWAMRRADVIVMPKLLSIVEAKEDRKNIIRKVRSLMKAAALVLFVDSPFEPELWHDFDVLYLSEREQFYQAQMRHEKFEHTDLVQSKARVAVLRKRLYFYRRTDRYNNQGRTRPKINWR